MSKTPTKNSAVQILDQDYLTSRDATVVDLFVNLQGEMTHFTGSAKRDPNDRENADVGVLLATARAYESLAQKLTKRANGLVKHNDDVAAHQNELRMRKPRKRIRNFRMRKLTKR